MQCVYSDCCAAIMYGANPDYESPPHCLSLTDEEGSPPTSSSSVFSRLEETRAQLETTLGLSSLLHAYQLIQVGVCVCSLFVPRVCSIAV